MVDNKEKTTTDNNNDNNNSNNNDSEKDSLGLRFYPGRQEKTEIPIIERLLQGTFDSETCRKICERNVVKAFEKNPLLKILRGALKNAGCPLDIKRHIVCEECSRLVQGGYDTEYNQIVVCQNLQKVRDYPEVILIHELVHMYDNCVNEINFKDLDHLACTEIRASNIAHCSFLSSFFMSQSSFFDIKKTHQNCVKVKAAESLSVARNIDFPTAIKRVIKVFDKCYNDLEPIGRRIRRNSSEGLMAEEEAKCFLITEE